MNQYSNAPERFHRTKKRPGKGRGHALLALAFIILASVTAWQIRPLFANDISVQDEPGLTSDFAGYPGNPQQERHSQTSNDATPTQAATQTFTFAELNAMSNDYLLLVNPWYAVPHDIAGNFVRIDGHVNSLNPNMLIIEDALIMLSAMFNSAASVGFHQFRVTQAFRTHEYQQGLYDQFAGTGIAARPGHSEHQVGLAVDISYEGVNIGNSLQGDWLMNYSYRYGFILRYPQHKTEITGIPFEPWHYRFVGQPHAFFMTHNDMVLEEYIAHLRNNREITVFVEAVEFNVFYLSHVDESIEIPYGQTFWASRDNTGGIIVTAINTNE